ncbi:MAG: hypothetical protein ACRDF7_01525 [Candidatus Limnocylindrales bacterium]
MSHPVLGLPAADPTVGRTDAAARLRRDRDTIGRLALQAALAADPGLADRYDETMQRRFLQDFQQHVEQLAQALETGEERYVTNYAEWLVPIYRRRHVPVRDQDMLLGGLREAAANVLTPDDGRALGGLVDAWLARLKFHRALPGDHKGNRVARIIWKGAGLLDETVI